MFCVGWQFFWFFFCISYNFRKALFLSLETRPVTGTTPSSCFPFSPVAHCQGPCLLFASFRMSLLSLRKGEAGPASPSAFVILQSNTQCSQERLAGLGEKSIFRSAGKPHQNRLCGQDSIWSRLQLQGHGLISGKMLSPSAVPLSLVPACSSVTGSFLSLRLRPNPVESARSSGLETLASGDQNQRANPTASLCATFSSARRYLEGTANTQGILF